ncbi:MAG: lipocalin family protein [Acidobacteriaceae bacterium]|nr:lipocalin family protein [Acidobacteriaceae bacterium]MBV9781198.1 lipocalin family protein [Acidobacteriaceae bacterium]
MQRFIISISAAALILVGLCWVPRPVSAAPKHIVGTWELVSGEINGQPVTGKHIKMISAHHFLWIIYDPKTLKTQGAGSGTYTVNGDSYVEHIEFFDVGGAEGMIGTDAKFTVKVDGDTLTQEGMAGTTQIKETYKRLD